MSDRLDLQTLPAEDKVFVQPSRPKKKSRAPRDDSSLDVFNKVARLSISERGCTDNQVQLDAGISQHLHVRGDVNIRFDRKKAAFKINLSECVWQKNDLVVADMCGRGLTDADIRVFVSWLHERIPRMYNAAQQSHLHFVLDMSQNHVTDLAVNGIVSLFVANRKFCHLEVLKLDQNAITDSGAHDLATLISQSPLAVAHLSLAHNRITHAGASVLINALKDDHRYPRAMWWQKQSLPMWLDLSFNQIEMSSRILTPFLSKTQESQSTPSQTENSNHQAASSSAIPLPWWCFAVDSECTPNSCTHNTTPLLSPTNSAFSPSQQESQFQPPQVPSQPPHQHQVKVHLPRFSLQFTSISSCSLLGLEKSATDPTSSTSKAPMPLPAGTGSRSPLLLFLDSSAIEKMTDLNGKACFTFDNIIERAQKCEFSNIRKRPAPSAKKVITSSFEETFCGGDGFDGDPVVLIVLDTVLHKLWTSAPAASSSSSSSTTTTPSSPSSSSQQQPDYQALRARSLSHIARCASFHSVVFVSTEEPSAKLFPQTLNSNFGFSFMESDKTLCAIAQKFDNDKRLKGNCVVVSDNPTFLNFSLSHELPSLSWAVLDEALKETDQFESEPWTSWHIRACLTASPTPGRIKPPSRQSGTPNPCQSPFHSPFQSAYSHPIHGGTLVPHFMPGSQSTTIGVNSPLTPPISGPMGIGSPLGMMGMMGMGIPMSGPMNIPMSGPMNISMSGPMNLGSPLGGMMGHGIPMSGPMNMGPPGSGPMNMNSPLGGMLGMGMGPMGIPMGGHMGIPMSGPMGIPMSGPMGIPMSGPMGSPLMSSIHAGSPLGGLNIGMMTPGSMFGFSSEIQEEGAASVNGYLTIKTSVAAATVSLQRFSEKATQMHGALTGIENMLAQHGRDESGGVTLTRDEVDRLIYETRQRPPREQLTESHDQFKSQLTALERLADSSSDL
eukprot:c9702_g1_i2.p1 GENE.c9702_g1_i2~~c9702_g1_i2.p1  ORF type:complete len:949 (+),score=172.75 c9702_g1_i2:189-3035(+)